jgi:hypothetical protein
MFAMMPDPPQHTNNQTMKTPENTFIIIRIETGEAVAELPDKLAANVNRSKYALERPSKYLPTLNQTKP